MVPTKGCGCQNPNESDGIMTSGLLRIPVVLRVRVWVKALVS